MADKKDDKLAPFRCKKCSFANTYVKKIEGDEDHRLRVCRRCGFEEKITFKSIQDKK